jgi:peptidoglycan/LPS O-acetylase OafA/YrhL
MFHHDGLNNIWPQAGNFAVQVFFALSGWLIGGLLMHLKASDVPRFYFNRAVRIWIPYFIAFALLVGASLLRDPVTNKWIEFVFYKFSFVYNIFGPSQLACCKQDMPLAGTGNHFWSVNAEEQFYLLAPLILVFVPSRYGRSVVVWGALALVAWVSKTYASIVFGVLAAVIESQFGIISRYKRLHLIYAICVAVSIYSFYVGWQYELIVPFCSIALVLLLAKKGGQNRLGTLVGGISYPLYLNHWIGVFVMNAIMKPFELQGSFLRHILSAIVNITFAALLYWWVDRSVLALRPRIYTEIRGRRAMVLAYGMVAIGICVGVFLKTTA